MTIFLAPGSIMALWGGGIDAIQVLTYWISVALQFFVLFFIYLN